MTAQSSPPQKRGYRPFSSIGAKITLILFAMGAASAIVGVLVSMVFSRVSEDMSTLTRDMLPQLEYRLDPCWQFFRAPVNGAPSIRLARTHMLTNARAPTPQHTFMAPRRYIN